MKREHIRGQYLINSFNLKNDLDQNGISDLLEEELNYTDLLNKVSDTVSKNNQKNRELDLKESQMQLDQKSEELRQLMDQTKFEQDSIFKQKELQLKAEIEKLKIEASKQKAAKQSKK
jgi:dihydroneopterin aldolase